MDEKTDDPDGGLMADQRRDALLLAALRKPPEPRKKRGRANAKTEGSKSHAAPDTAPRRE